MIEELLKEKGYKEKEINKILSSYSLLRFDEEKLVYHIKYIFNFLLALGYTKSQIIKITSSFPTIYSYNIKTLEKKICDMLELGYDRSNFLKMTLIAPNIYGLSYNNIKKKILYLESLGYTKEQALKITVNYSCILGSNIENIKKKILAMENLGYTRKQVILMTTAFPSIYGLSVDGIKAKILSIEKLGYQREQVIQMTLSLPTIYGCNIDKFREKILYFRKIGIEDYILEKPKNLMQSIDLTYARYTFLTKEMDIDNISSKARLLFLGENKFKKQFGTSKEELLKKYNYDEKIGTMKKTKVLE